MDKRFLGHSDRFDKLARLVPAAVRGVVPAEPLDRRPGPEGLPRGQRVASLRRHVPGVRAVPDPVARVQTGRGRSRVRRAPRPLGGRGRSGRTGRPVGLRVLPDRVPVLCGACPAPRPHAGPAQARRVLRRRLSQEDVSTRVRGAHRVRRARLGHVLQRPGRPARRRHRVLCRPGMGLFGGHRRHGGSVHVGQGDRAHRTGRVRRLRHTVRQQVVEQGEIHFEHVENVRFKNK